MSKHTPGPWHGSPGLPEPGETWGHFPIFKGTTAICLISRIYDHDEETVANARLIAAAPDLLEALEYIADMHLQPGDEMIHIAKIAVAKAKREST